MFAAFGREDMWIGLDDRVTEGVFQWSDGRTVSINDKNNDDHDDNDDHDNDYNYDYDNIQHQDHDHDHDHNDNYLKSNV